ncbi:hypothetical protein F383_39482 [Gossypium arboreum]|uniref:Uncharacterized protein n=1 Tax=Gossypium arboreum TaxID=29729 RepID=A0A0B0MT20_GOSAR|nr:hypothetical protein F383_39482 [Gossypium arboreum]
MSGNFGNSGMNEVSV